MIRALLCWWLRYREGWMLDRIAVADATIAGARMESDRAHDELRRIRSRLAVIEPARAVVGRALSHRS